jgi:hypothetical protein
MVLGELRARLCYLSRFLLVFGSLEFCLVPLPLFVLVLLVFACLCLSLVFAVVRLVSDERALCILGRGEVLADASI